MLAAAVLARLPGLVAAGAGTIAAGYAASITLDGRAGLDRVAPLVAAGLLLACELAYWAHELATTSPDEPGLRALHVAWLGLVTLAGLALATALIVLANLADVEGLAVEAVGAAAALGVAALIVLGGRRAR